MGTAVVKKVALILLALHFTPFDGIYFALEGGARMAISDHAERVEALNGGVSSGVRVNRTG